MTVYYRVPAQDDTAFELECRCNPLSTNSLNRESIAQECGEDYYANHDGWECKWPLTIAIHATEDGPELFRCIVERETVPTFSAKVVVPKEEVKRD